MAVWKNVEFDVSQYLSAWFWLTDGCYWLNTAGGQILARHPDFLIYQNPKTVCVNHLDYYIARFWQDLGETLATARQPLPNQLASWVESGLWHRWERRIQVWWSDLEDDASFDANWNLLCVARAWWSARRLGMGYLVAPPRLRFWHFRNAMAVEWDTRECLVDGVQCFVETHGRQTFELATFEREVVSFRDRLAAAMRERLSEVETLQILDTDKIADLWRQHDSALSEKWKPEVEDWTKIQSAVARLEEISGIRMDTA